MPSLSASCKPYGVADDLSENSQIRSPLCSCYAEGHWISMKNDVSRTRRAYFTFVGKTWAIDPVIPA